MPREQKARQKAGHRKAAHRKAARSDTRFKPGVTPPGARPWKPGESGNPEGSSRGRRLTTLLLGKLKTAFPGDTKGRLTQTLVVEALLRAGILGNVPALKLIFDRVDGPVLGDEGTLPLDDAGVVRVRMTSTRLAELLARRRG